jgi:hypothetical protein
MEFADLVGQTLRSVYVFKPSWRTPQIIVKTDKQRFRMYCEDYGWGGEKFLGDVLGDVRDLIGEPLLAVDVVETSIEMGRHTSITFATRKGSVLTNWFVTDNLYSLSIDISEIEKGYYK